MELLKAIRPYLKTFYLFGQSSYVPKSPRSHTTKKKSSIPHLSKVPTILWAAICFSVSAILIWVVNISSEKQYFGRTDAIMTNLFIFCEVTKTSAVFVQSLFYNQVLRDVLQNFENMETFFACNLHYRISYTTFERQFFRKTIIIFAGYAQSMLPHILGYAIFSKLDKTSVLIKIMQIESTIIIIHMMFYIDVLRFHLSELNKAIERDGGAQNTIQNNIMVVYKKSTKETLVANKIKNYKHVHYRLWNANQQINYIFGWSLTAVFLQTFVDCVYNAYWQYTSFNWDVDFVSMIRKWSLYNNN